MEHLPGCHRFGAAAGMAVIQPPFIIKNARTVAHGNPLHVAHGDVANASHGAAQTLHDVADWELVGELREVNDVVVVGEPNPIGGDDGNGG